MRRKALLHRAGNSAENNAGFCMRVPWNKGKKMKKKKFDENVTVRKGDKKGYQAVHHWISYNYGKADRCDLCKSRNKKRYEWSNKDHKYRRRRKDYQKVCVKCHRDYDRKKFGTGYRIMIWYEIPCWGCKKKKMRKNTTNKYCSYKCWYESQRFPRVKR